MFFLQLFCVNFLKNSFLFIVPPLKPEEETAHKEAKDAEKRNEEGECEGEGEVKKKLPKRTVRYESHNQITKDDLFQR